MAFFHLPGIKLQNHSVGLSFLVDVGGDANEEITLINKDNISVWGREDFSP